MIVNIILILSCLVVLNFLLLIFSCNKTSKKVKDKVPSFTKVEEKSTIVVSNQLQTHHLAPTGS